MTWKEAQAAFKQQVPVIYHPMQGGEIPCTRIAEISLRCSRDGQISRVVGRGWTGTKTAYTTPRRTVSACRKG